MIAFPLVSAVTSRADLYKDDMQRAIGAMDAESKNAMIAEIFDLVLRHKNICNLTNVFIGSEVRSIVETALKELALRDLLNGDAGANK